MVVGESNISNINNIMGGIENTGSIRLNNHKRKLKQRFDIIKKLGQGTYGKVQLGINKETGQEVAIKTIKKSKIETEADLIRIRREIQIMSSVQHPNIIHIYEVFENREKMVLVMEYAAGGELYDYLSERKVLVEEEARRIFRQIATACYYCHKHKICHRDLKLENILLDENKNAKIADFGLSNVFDDQRLLSTFCGSPLYASPEIVKGTPYHGPEVDCWSLGVLLYTLVYGAMPFDGSNFKRLVKQISQGDYFEPKQPSPASPLILEMLTVNAKNRANIEKICAHWWVNEGYDESCLDISEELANQTPVRLDVLLSLNPPPPQLESDQLVVTGEVGENNIKAEPAVPTRSQSAGSLMDVSNPAERRIKDLIAQELKSTPKRKLETTLSTEQANVASDVKRKEKIIKENTVADISVCNNSVQNVKMDVADPNLKIVENSDITDPSLQGAACTEILEDAKKNESKKPLKVKKTKSVSVSNKILEEINEVPSQENIPITSDKNKENEAVTPETTSADIKESKEENKSPVKKKLVKKKALSDKNDIVKPTTNESEKSANTLEKKPIEIEKIKPEKVESKEGAVEMPAKPMERRQSRIFEQAEKFQNMITSTASEAKIPSPEKPKKIVIPGVSVGGFKKEFERKASLTSVSPPKVKAVASKKLIIDEKQPSVDNKDVPSDTTAKNETDIENKSQDTQNVKELNESNGIKPLDEDHKQKLKNAVSIISNALDKEGTRKSKSRPCVGRKPPVPFGTSGRSASGSISLISPLSPPPTKDLLLHKTKNPEQVKHEPELAQPGNKKSSAEIILKSATLPRRKSTKAEIQLEYPTPKPAIVEFKTEMIHPVQGAAPQNTQKSEVVFPVNVTQNTGYRSASLEPESKSTKVERIIPIAFEKPVTDQKESITSPPPMKPPLPRAFQSQKSITSQRSNSLSRQSTQESDTETSISGDPIKKSPREYIIPIAVEGGGYVTPRAGSLEPSETSSTITNSSRISTGSKFSRPRRMMSLFDREGSEDESPFSSLHRHCSFGKDSDTEGEPKRDAFHMHRLRSSRPRKSKLEHTDSLSSGEDDDDDDGFEFLTAENLFSTLLSRVRDLTQRINSDDGSRPGFPSSRLLGNFDHSNFWNRMEPPGTSRNSPLARHLSRERSINNSSIPWRRSVSRDLASDINSVFNDGTRSNRSSTLPRGEDTGKEDLNLSDLNLKKLKLTDEDALALSYLTPGLSRRIQKQLFASLPPSEARKISRTMSMRNDEDKVKDFGFRRRSVDRISSTLPRKFSYDKPNASQQNLLTDINQNNSNIKESNNFKSESTLRDVISPFSDKSSYSDISKPKYYGSSSLREPTDYKSKYHHSYSFKSPDSSLSEISSIRDEDHLYPYRSETGNSLSKFITSNNHKVLDESKPTRKVSRFLRPDFYDSPKDENKDKKEREMETQKVLKEIRDKRIKNRISMRRERSLSRDKSLEDSENKSRKDENGNAEIVHCKDLVNALNQNNDNLQNNVGVDSTEKILDNVSENIKNIESNVINAQNLIKKERISKLMRPKSYPAEKGAISKMNKVEESKSPEKTADVEKLDAVKSSKISKFKKNNVTSINQVSKTKEPEKVSTTKSKFLQSIEKKFEKLRTFNDDKNKDESKKSATSKSKDENKKLGNTKSKEESNAIKEEKKSAVESTIKLLREQSVPRTTDHITESTLIKRAVSVEDFSNVKSKALQPSRKSVTKILSLFKKYEEKPQNKCEEKARNKSEEKVLANGIDPVTAQLPNIHETNIPILKTNQEEERPKSLHLDKNKQFNGVKSSKLPVNSFRRSLNLEPREIANNNPDRRDLNLDFSKLDNPSDINLNRMSYTTDESSAPFSPGDESLSCDSWSACSDLHHTQDLVSPTSPNGNTYNTSGDESESVGDRIRRKSFYTRFNEKKKPRKNVIGNYRDLDLYKEYNTKPSNKYKVTPEYSAPSTSYKRSLGYSSLSNDGEKDYKSYLRSKPIYNDNYYKTYNPKRSNIASLYSTEDSALDDSILTGSYKKYSYSPNKSRLDNSNRDSRSPSSDFHYTHNSQMSTSEHSSNSLPTDNMHSFTEHAV